MKWLDWKKPVPRWALPSFLAIFLAMSLMVALLFAPGSLFGPDFAMVLEYNNLTVNAFYCGFNPSPCNHNSTFLTITPLRSFTGIITVRSAASSPGIRLRIDGGAGSATQPPWVALGPATNMSLTIESGTIGNYTATVTASSGSIVHALVIPVRVQNITFTLSSRSLSVPRGSSATVIIEMTSVNRFASRLIMTGYPPDPNTQTVSFSPPRILLQPGASARTILTINVSSSSAPRTQTLDVLIYQDIVSQTSYSFDLGITLTTT